MDMNDDIDIRGRDMGVGIVETHCILFRYIIYEAECIDRTLVPTIGC